MTTLNISKVREDEKNLRLISNITPTLITKPPTPTRISGTTVDDNFSPLAGRSKNSNDISKGKNIPNDQFAIKRRSKLVESIKELIESEENPPKKSIFKFENTLEASNHNGKILRSCNYDYEKILEKQKDTNIYYGSEFRQVYKLRELLHLHRDWNRLETFLTKGTDTVFKHVDDDIIKKDCEENMKRGNHKSSSKSLKEVEFVKKQYGKEVSKGWMIPLPAHIVPKLKDACVIPIGVAKSFSINERNENIEKLRLTHDCSWEGPSSFSVNSRIDEDLLPPLQYGRCLLRVLHNLQQLRHNNPNKRILMAKHDLDSAYRRLHWHAKCALLCITVVSNIAYILTRLCFGIASGPNEWCLISELMVDFATALIEDSSWDPSELFNPNEDIPTDIDYVDPSIKIENVKNVIFENRKTKKSYIDGYIDDLLTIILEELDLLKRGLHVIPLICLILFRPVHKNEPILRTDILSKAKLIAEGMLAERKTFLGWIIDSRRMRVYLPQLKTLRWMNELDELLSLERVSQKQLESILGKLNHAAFIIPLSRYFLNRLRHTESLSKKFGPQKLSQGTREDILLFKDFLSIMNLKGSSIQNITHSLPDVFCWSDACEFGLGGFNSKGLAWQWKIPKNLRGRASINLLEFIASIITILFSTKNLSKNKKVFALTDNSSALGWLYKASFHPAEKENHDTVARFFAKNIIRNEHSVYAEHIKGSSNNVADSLSREFNFSKSQLTNLLYCAFDEQMPPNFQIQDLPEEDVSWISSLLESMTIREVQKSNFHRKSTQPGESGRTFAEKLGSKIDSLKDIPRTKKSSFCAHSQQRLEEIFLEEQIRKYCTEIPCKVPQDMFARSSGLTDLAIQELTTVA